MLTPATEADAAQVLRADVADYLDYIRGELGLAANTQSAYRRCLESFAAWAAAGGLADYLRPTPAELSSYLTSLHEAGLSAASVGCHVAAVRSLYRFLKLAGRIDRDPAARLRPPRKAERVPRALPSGDVRKLLAAPRRSQRCYHRDKALLEVLFASGARASEVCGLALADLDLEGGVCRCRGKGGKERLLRLGRKALDALRGYLAELRPALTRARPDAAALFLTRRGRPLTRGQVWAVVKKYARLAGLPPRVTTHQLRHSFATALVQGGADLRAVQELLGHATIQHVQVYVAVDRARLRAVHAKYHPRGS